MNLRIKSPEKPLNLTLLVPDFRSGGLQKVMIQLANGLERRGFSVTLLALQAEGEQKDLISPRVKLYDGHTAPRYSLSLLPLIRYFKTQNPDVFFSSLYIEPTILAHRLTQNKSKIIATVHGSPRGEIVRGQRKWARKTALLFSRLLAQYADFAVAVSSGVREEMLLNGFTPEKTVTIYNPVITQDSDIKKQEPLTHPWFTDKRLPIIISVGRLTPSKGFDRLIRAFHTLQRGGKSRLFIIGEGEERARLEQFIYGLNLQDRIQLPGYIDNPLPYMAQADVFVLASSFEGLPTVLVEALFCGTPIVSTDCPHGPREILDNGRYGTLVPVDDECALAQAIQETLIQKHEKAPLIKRAQDFSEGRALDQYCALIRTVTGSSAI